jgi:hypothetical protein
MNIDQLVPLLGKSERDDRVKSTLAYFGFKGSLPRPRRGEDKVHIELPEYRMEFVFASADLWGKSKSDLLEGELIFYVIFFWPDENDFAKNTNIPFGINLRSLRDEHLRLLGTPEWSNSEQTHFRWVVNDIKLFLSYHEDEKLKKITFQMF